MKKIALFSDGTGNSSASPQKTNVWRAYQALDRSEGSRQIAYYDNGVGTSWFRPLAILGLAFGFGLTRNVLKFYRFVCRNYNPGDEIYGFGFSRGAFTMRIFMALIANQGIIDRKRATDERDLERLIIYAYRRFRRENFTPSVLTFFLVPLRDLVAGVWCRIMGKDLYDPQENIRYWDQPGDRPLIKFVGVWDIVPAYGLAVDELTRAWDKVVWPLLSRTLDLSPRYGRVRHALALDEQRSTFRPLLWNEHDSPIGNTIDDEQLSQVWFAGVHANVGGGYPDDSLALTALNWILDESEKDGGLTYLSEERRRFREQADRNGPLYDSRSGLGILYRYAPRNLEHLCSEKNVGLAQWVKQIFCSDKFRTSWTDAGDFREIKILKPKIHRTVFDRIAQGHDAYAPINIPDDYAIVNEDGTIKDMSDNNFIVPENKSQAELRRQMQSYVWNKVWARAISYYVGAFLILSFIFYPNIRNVEKATELSFLEKIIWYILLPFYTIIELIIGVARVVNDHVTNITGIKLFEEWFEFWQNIPYAFISFIMIIVIFFWWDRELDKSIKGEMRANWYHVFGGDSFSASRVRNPSHFSSKLATLLDGRPNGWRAGTFSIGDRIASFIGSALEFCAFAIILLVVVVGASRWAFYTADTFSGICEPKVNNRDIVFDRAFEFDPKELCFDTGLDLERDKLYEIKMRISDDWSDASIYADVRGWRDKTEKGGFLGMQSPPWYMDLFLPLRRHLFAQWYEPVARIGEEAFYSFSLVDQRVLADMGNMDRQMNFETVIRAGNWGRLYLYLNDVVVFLPGIAEQFFYQNNNGCAWVTVTPLSEGETADPPADDEGYPESEVELPGRCTNAAGAGAGAASRSDQS